MKNNKDNLNFPDFSKKFDKHDDAGFKVNKKPQASKDSQPTKKDHPGEKVDNSLDLQTNDLKTNVNLQKENLADKKNDHLDEATQSSSQEPKSNESLNTANKASENIAKKEAKMENEDQKVEEMISDHEAKDVEELMDDIDNNQNQANDPQAKNEPLENVPNDGYVVIFNADKLLNINLATKLAKSSNLILIGENQAKLDALEKYLGDQSKTTIVKIASDFVKETAVEEIYNKLTDYKICKVFFNLSDLEIQKGLFIEQNLETDLTLIHKYLFNYHHLIRMLLNDFIKKNCGKFIFLLSENAFAGESLNAINSALNSYYYYLLEAINFEFVKTKSHVRAFCWLVDDNLLNQAKVKKIELTKEKASDLEVDINLYLLNDFDKWFTKGWSHVSQKDYHKSLIFSSLNAQLNQIRTRLFHNNAVQKSYQNNFEECKDAINALKDHINKTNYKKNSKQYALITGASYGIGYAFAEKLAEKNYDLILVARSSERLKEIKENFEHKYKTKVFVRVADLTNLDVAKKLYEEFSDHDLNLVINNAGFGSYTFFNDAKIARDLSMLHLNVGALHILTKLFLQKFVRENQGIVLNISSVAGYAPIPLFATYSASKTYVMHLSEAIDNELKNIDTKARCICLAPGRTTSRFSDNALNNSHAKASEKILKDAKVLIPQINEIDKKNTPFLVAAEDLAKWTLDDLFDNPSSKLIYTKFNKHYVFMSRLTPRKMLGLRYASMLKLLNTQPDAFGKATVKKHDGDASKNLDEDASHIYKEKIDAIDNSTQDQIKKIVEDNIKHEEPKSEDASRVNQKEKATNQKEIDQKAKDQKKAK